MRKIGFVTLLVVIVVLWAASQSQPRFEGTWLMDKSRSQYPAETAVEVIHQHGVVVDISLSEKWPGRPDRPIELHLTTDGKPTVNTVAENKFTSTTHWDGKKLVTFVEGDRGQHMTETRELSGGEKELTVTGYHQDELTKPYYIRVMVRGDASNSHERP
jgi:hypothetical protein